MGKLERIREEVKQQLWIVLPMMGVNAVQSALQLVSVIFVGHLGELQLAGSSVATSFAFVTGYSLLLGLSSALETLCGQAYGARQYHMVGIYTQRAMLVLTLVALPISVLWFNMEHVLLALGQDADIASTAGVYSRFLIPGLFAYPFLQPLNKFLQSQSVVLPIFVCSSVTLLVHTLVCWTLVYKLRLGNRGAAMASSISNWMDVVSLSFVVLFTPKCRACWVRVSSEIFGGAKQFLGLAIPSAVMICLEGWCWEVLILLSGLLPNPQLEASMISILFNTWPVLVMFPISLGTATSVRVSNELGAERPEAAKFAFSVAMGLAAVGAVLVSATAFGIRNVLGKLFSNELDVINYVTRMFTLLALYPLISAFQGPASGAVRGSGRQGIAAIIDLAAYYVVGWSVSYVLAFTLDMRGMGLILGVLSGDALQTFIFVALAFWTNWEKEASKAADRIGSPLLS